MEKLTLLPAVVLLMCSVSVSISAAQGPQEHDLRLVNGPTSMEGRLEIFFQGEWRPVSDEDVKIEEASVVCRQLGFLYAVEVKSFGPGSGVVVIKDLNCNGNEASILDCYHDVLGKSPYLRDRVGVNCSNVLTTEVPTTYAPDITALLNNGKFRLVDGPDPYQGRVEVFRGKALAWMPICNVDWDFTRASFVCEKLGFRPATVAGTGNYGPGAGQIANCSAAAFDYDRIDIDQDSCRIVNESDAVGECSHDTAVDVTCSGTEPGTQDYLRFVGGSQQSEGRVEIYNDNVWKGLCSDDWTMAEAQVSCRQQGLPPPQEVVSGGTFGSSKAGDILQVSLDCTGQEFSLATCPQMARQTLCASGDAAVRCGEPSEAQEFDLRLANGGTTWEGRVEMFYQGEWGTICHPRWVVFHEAMVACRQLGFQYAEGLTREFGPGVGNVILHGLLCNGNEERLVDCYYRQLGIRESPCDHSEDFGIICSNIDPMTPPYPTRDGALRLVGGPDPSQGRVEVYIAEEGAWARICSENWDFSRAESVCQQLKYRPATSTGTGRYGAGTGSIVTCPITGISYTSLDTENCQLTDTCTQDMDVFVVCSGKEQGIKGEIRLVNGSEPTEGRVEIYDQNAWKTLCADDFTYVAQQISCRQLNVPFPPKEVPGGMFGESQVYDVLDDVLNCTLRTTQLKFCDRAPRQTPCVGGHAAVQCGIWKNADEWDLRLSGGLEEREGRVEIFHNGQWGQVCDDLWDDQDANVVCHHLGYRNLYSRYTNARYLSRNGALVWLKSLRCQGNEEHISECGAVLGEPVDCTGSFAEVMCEDRPFASNYEARLVDGPHPNQGRLELLYEGAWWTVCDDDWDMKDAEVACRQLGFASAVAALDGDETASLYGSGEGGILLYELGCDGTEESIIKCPLSYPFAGLCRHDEDVGVVCFSEDYPSDDPRPEPEDPGDGLSSAQIRNIILYVLIGCSLLLTVCGCVYKLHKIKSEPQVVVMGPNEGFTGAGTGQYSAVSQDAPPAYEDVTKDPGKLDTTGGTESAEPSAPPPTYAQTSTV
ncbi:deleted in malignant brain tumors 1 protein-like [Patiria miniata]|uniref:SRCR domain-containing protein n=1 Tax=Patiria miniata TaxID=46514 RepID=A0A914BQS6_PATMI|nr:deleted in malignant brain tumors 1 protein-like [Patiria miniata]XP_038077829.1 deleted in malignant brain tumors 1 protein-like [Patiria miniata]XP_038077837.1 deleted in malignant brain tumors 1 protein-like [Patiria miniata]XP_038077846.1 deleted in malignant brain tumors 1 protein-like [Patiria miniata]